MKKPKFQIPKINNKRRKKINKEIKAKRWKRKRSHPKKMSSKQSASQKRRDNLMINDVFSLDLCLPAQLN